MRHITHRDTAVAALGTRSYEAAGDAYSRAGRSVLADPRDEIGPFEEDPKGWVGRALQFLCLGTIAYRLAGADSRATFRGVEATAATRDLRAICTEPIQRAVLTELVADMHVAAGLDGADSIYDDAATRYEQTAPDDPMGWATTPLFEAANVVIQQVARGPANGEIAVNWEDLHGADPNEPGAYLAHRAQYKRRRFPSLVEKVLETSYLAAPRGTTEYGNSEFRCPECRSRDVNWTGDSILCMRCSHPVDRV